MKVALDTNVLVYAEGLNGESKMLAALSIIEKLPQGAGLLPVQVLGELFHVMVRKAGRSRISAREATLGWRDAFNVIDTSNKVMVSAVDLATDHQLNLWDAVVIAASSSAGCRLLLSEDCHEGFTWGGVTVVNPFSEVPHPLFTALLSE